MASGEDRGPETSNGLEVMLENPDQTTGEGATPRQRGWTWYSSVESAEQGLVSVLAIVETIAASVVYGWIAWRFGTLHLTISACVAPFLLLRTPRSVSLALSLFFRAIDALNNVPDFMFKPAYYLDDRISAASSTLITYFLSSFRSLYIIITLVPMIASIGLIALLVRIIATIATTIRHPLQGISKIPANWWTSSACIDSRQPMEVLPGGARASPRRDFEWLVPSTALKELVAKTNRSRFVLYLIAVPTFVVTLLGPALFYRWSLKGAALVYSPLVWIVRSATATPLIEYLQDIHELVQYRLTRWFAALVLLLFIAKVYIYYAWSDLASSWRFIPGHRLLEAIVMPEAFPPWQVASAVNAILAWVLYIAADRFLVRWRRGSTVSLGAIEVMLRWLSLVRGALSIYTIVCGIYLAASLVDRLGLPAMGARILPWQ